jgi:hypothetical protein
MNDPVQTNPHDRSRLALQHLTKSFDLGAWDDGPSCALGLSANWGKRAHIVRVATECRFGR